MDPDFYEYLQENDSGLLEEMADDSDEGSLDNGEAELMEDDQSSSDNDLGTVEPRPLHVTSRKEVSLSLIVRKQSSESCLCRSSLPGIGGLNLVVSLQCCSVLLCPGPGLPGLGVARQCQKPSQTGPC